VTEGANVAIFLFETGIGLYFNIAIPVIRNFRWKPQGFGNDDRRPILLRVEQIFQEELEHNF